MPGIDLRLLALKVDTLADHDPHGSQNAVLFGGQD
jgi:hypothetical protein